MKIIYVLPHPIQYQTPLINYLKLKGLDITVAYKSDHTSKKYYDYGFKKKIQWNKKILKGYNYFYNQNHKIFKYILTKKKVKYVWVHGSKNFYNLLIIIFSKFLNKKVLLREESFIKSKKRNLLNILFNKLFYLFIDFFIYKYLAIGNQNKNFYIKNNVKLSKIIKVPYCVDNSFFSHKNFNKKKTKIIKFLFAGKLTKKKGLDILIKAFQKISLNKKIKKKYSLTIVGNGDYYKKIKMIVRKNNLHFIKILNFKTQNQIKIIYKNSDILILPSRFEPWGLVINEAMNSGNAIICSDNVGSANDLVKNNINGFVFKSENINKLVDAIMKYIEQPDLINKHKKNGIKIINKFSFEICYKNLSRVIN